MRPARLAATKAWVAQKGAQYENSFGRGCAWYADRGYDSDEIIEYAKNQGIQPVIPPRKNRKIQHNFNKTLYKKRHRVENAFLRLKRSWRGIATRYTKRISSFIAFVHLACSIEWLKALSKTRVDIL